jgi:hypothetical protein
VETRDQFDCDGRASLSEMQIDVNPFATDIWAR